MVFRINALAPHSAFQQLQARAGCRALSSVDLDLAAMSPREDGFANLWVRTQSTHQPSCHTLSTICQKTKLPPSPSSISNLLPQPGGAVGEEPRSPGCGLQSMHRQSDLPPPGFSSQALSTRIPRLQPCTHPQTHSPPRLEIHSHQHHPAPLPMNPPLQKHPDPSQAYFKIPFYFSLYLLLLF